MIKKINKYLSPDLKKAILRSLPFRLYQRACLGRHDIVVNCEITTKCNLACVMCSRESLVQKKLLVPQDMPADLTACMIEQMKMLGRLKKKIIFGPMGLGEPLMHHDLFGFLEQIRMVCANTHFTLVTNGTLLKEDVIKKIISFGFDEVSVSLNFESRNGYQEGMGKDFFGLVSSNIENLLRLRNESKTLLPAVSIQRLDFNFRQDEGKESMPWAVSMKHYDKCFVHSAVSHAGFAGPHCMQTGSGLKFPCAQPLFTFAIKVNGDIYPCCSALYSGNMKVDSLYLGNIRDTSLVEIYKRKKTNTILAKMKKNDYTLLPECKKCNAPSLGANCFFLLPRPLRKTGWVWI